MGQRGPTPQPTALKVLRGERKDRIRQGPNPAKVEVKPPTGLSAAARRIWRQLAPDLERKGLLTFWDTEAFATWCEAAATRRRAAKALQSQGEVVVGTRGTPIRNPWCLVQKDATETLIRLGSRFGLSPSDRDQLPARPVGKSAASRLLTGAD